MNGIVFDIQHYAIYDGPGIRTCVFFKGCPLRCKWCHNPESHLTKPQMTYFVENCAACGACIDACTSGALKSKDKTVVRDLNGCNVCGDCADVCPNQAVERIGNDMTPDEIAERVLQDKIFYENSGGGVTISGGEPTFQAGFLLRTLSTLKKAGIQTALETCGYFKEGLLVDLLNLVDLFLFDIKHIDPGIHKDFTGVSNEIILTNLSRILSSAGGERLIPRIAIIPGFNADFGSIDKIIAHLSRIGYSGQVHLMPYNAMARTKWEKIGRGTLYKYMGPLSDEFMEGIKSQFEQASFEVIFNHG